MIIEGQVRIIPHQAKSKLSRPTTIIIITTTTTTTTTRRLIHNNIQSMVCIVAVLLSFSYYHYYCSCGNIKKIESITTTIGLIQSLYILVL